MSGAKEFFERVGTDHRPGANSGQSAAAPDPSAPTPAGISVAAFSHGVRRWAQADDLFWAAPQICDTVPAALYRCTSCSTRGPMLRQVRCETDGLVEFPDSPSAEVLTEIRQFWELKPPFAARGFLHKRGVLLWGCPGSGKTATLHQLVSVVIRDHDGIAIFVDHPSEAAAVLQLVRRIEPERPLIVLFEDLDALVQRYGENEYLALLDGESQVANVTFVATTNYPERLDRRFVDRPSRFDLIKEIGMPSAAARRAYLCNKEPTLAGDELEAWVEVSDGFSIAHLREMIILCFCYGRTLDEAIERLDRMRGASPSSSQADDGRRTVVGFSAERVRR